jgi:uncharacterized protein with HEPN domain
MRPRDPRIALAAVISAGEAIESFLDGRTFAEYGADLQLSSAVERQFEIVGEALGRAVRADSSLAASLPEAPEIVGFRNVLAHGYDAVSDALVWSIAREKLPALLAAVRNLLTAEEASS